jgi:CubicO group peptidase (beta-lactamase class C family)
MPPIHDALHDILSDAIRLGVFTGAQLVVSDLCSVRQRLCIGRLSSDVSSPLVSFETLFDVASLTKPFVTATLVMIAIEEGHLSLDQCVGDLPIVAPRGIHGSTLADLLSHSTDLQAWFDFSACTAGSVNRLEAMQRVACAIEVLPLRGDPHVGCYSDLGYILLGMLLEQCYSETIAELFDLKIATYLGLKSDMMFCPLQSFPASRCVATHFLRDGSVLQGLPDDDNVRCMGHMAGHAGLFSTAEGIATYVRAYLGNFFPSSRSLRERFLAYASSNFRFALGWDRPTGSDSLSGRGVGDPVRGHLGYTGCSVWFDLTTGISVTLLTNRSHCNHEPQTLAPIRKRLHRLIWETYAQA